MKALSPNHEKSHFTNHFTSASSRLYDWICMVSRVFTGQARSQEHNRKAPFVETITVQAEVLRSTVSTSGTVRPRTQTDLLAEVPGIIEAVAPFPQEQNSSAPFEQVDFSERTIFCLGSKAST